MIKIEESTIPAMKVTYELPIRAWIQYIDYDEYDYFNDEGYFEDIKAEAENDWNNSNMVQYLKGDLVGAVTDMRMECILPVNGRMVCHITCTVSPAFTDEDSDMLMDWITGQMSDGWGEGFEQREVAKFKYENESEEYDEDEGEYYTEYYDETAYVYGQFWWSSKTKNWYIREI